LGTLVARAVSIARTTAFVLVAAVLVGVAYERVARARDQEQHPAPGRLVDIGSHRLHIVCSGSGATTVVLEAGLGESSLGWATVQRDLARTFRVCAYDRAGMAWSDPSTEPRTARRAAEELRTLLALAGESGPYVVVAHSFGAFAARTFVDLRPGDVAGLVLVDPTSEDGVIATWPRSSQIITRRTYAALGEIGLLRIVGRALVNGSVGGHAPAEVLDRVPVLYGPNSQAAALAELDVSIESAMDVRALQPDSWKSLRVVIISAADTTAAEREYHGALARLSPRGRHLVAPTGGHYVHYENARFVGDLIRELALAASVFLP
jgi:pimeloyl-ACP methyl ester carboxylesterase